ncbi:MAG: hypothetical protein MN733_32865 [Nitrososphaera sp.]|nr:hypothetical protein [Nitrososphaera sp.]
MNKYGVSESVERERLAKLAQSGCPNCGGKVRREGDLLFCEKCGTEPFEGERSGS